MIKKNDNIVTGLIIILGVSERSFFNHLKETDGLENRKVAEKLIDIYKTSYILEKRTNLLNH